MKRLFLILFLFINLLGYSVLTAQEAIDYHLSTDSAVNAKASFRRTYYATRITTKPRIDGKLDEECWSLGVWDGDFVQQQPNQAKAPSQQTEIKILYDDDNLYFAGKCYDNEPGKIRAILGRRDVLAGDIIGVALDSYHDKLTAYEFNVTAAGQKIDLSHLGSYKWDFNWNAVWDGKSSVGDSLWTVEMRIPFSQIRFTKQENQVWGMHIWRWIDRFKEESEWKLIPVDAPAMVYLFGELRGIEGIRHKKNFEIMPYASAKFVPQSNPEKSLHGGIGIDGKIGITSNFTVDYTLNPDFGQVEADPSVLNLTSFETFYEEKRPFFLEGNAILDFKMGDDLLFYSRRIGQAPSYYPNVEPGQTVAMPENTTILSALKLTGKTTRGLSVGVVQSFTARENSTIYTGNSEEKVAVEPFTSFMVGRLKQELNKGNTVIGGMITSSIRNIRDSQLDFIPGSSYTGGLDLEHNWKNRKYFIDFKGFFSQVNGSKPAITQLQESTAHYYQREDASHLNLDPDRTSLSGFGGKIDGGKRSGKFRMTGGLDWRSPGVDLNDIGYLRQADFVRQNLEFSYKVDKPRGILLNYQFGFKQSHEWSFGGENIMNNVAFDSKARFKNLWDANFTLKKDINQFDTRELRGGPKLFKENNTEGNLQILTNSVKKLSFGVATTISASQDRISQEKDYILMVKWQMNNRLSISTQTGYHIGTDNQQYVNTISGLVAHRDYIVGKIDQKTLYTTIRFEYYVSPELSFQYYGSPYASIGKYDNFRRVTDASNRDLNQRNKPLTVLATANNFYSVDATGDHVEDFKLKNPDFNFQEFRSNLVGRWEYSPGSTLYLVWTNTRSLYSDSYKNAILDSFGGISSLKAKNVFMVKLNYWFSL
jgi:hypothetical protein